MDQTMLRRVLLWTVFIAFLLLLVLGSGVYWLGKRAEPDYDGRLVLPRLSNPVSVRFGPHAVPSIAASSLPDLVRAQGYVVASERLWQMDLMRRLASGRLAELFGAGALPVDRFFRTVGLASEASRSLEALKPGDRALLTAYAEGVNAYIASARWRPPLEYLLAHLAPEPWRPEDSLAIGAYMTWTQSFNLNGELSFLRMAEQIGPELARTLFPVDEGIPAPPVEPALVRYLRQRDPGRRAALDDRQLADILQWPGSLGMPIPGPASNAWVVSGPKTAGGVALLANDPHLAAAMPGIWYELELSAPGLHVAGVALPGVPLILIGHNADLAWGITSVIADTQDVFIEQITPDGQHVARAGDRPEPIETRRETIGVKGQPPVKVAIRRTRHGVVLNDILGRITGTQMDLPQSGLSDLLVLRQSHDRPELAFQGVRRLCQATTLGEAMAAGLDFRHVAVNLMLAHRDGGIAWQVTGMLPQRGKGSGAFPMPGWLPEYDWQGFVPQALNPSERNPANGVLITANNRTVRPDDPVQVSSSWNSPHRAQRIGARLSEMTSVTPANMASVQADLVSLQARDMRERLAALEPEIRALDPEAWEWVETLFSGWNGAMSPDSRSAAFAERMEPALFHALYGDELGDDLDWLMSQAIVHYPSLQETLHTGESPFWDDRDTPEVETPAEIWVRAIHAAAAAMGGLEANPKSSRLSTLSEMRSVTFAHAFGSFPIIGRLFNVGPVPVGGSSDTVNVTNAMPQDPGHGLFISSMRVVATPADWTQTRGTLPLGESGHRFSRYRTDQLDDWLAVRGHPWPWNGPAAGTTIGELELTPDD